MAPSGDDPRPRPAHTAPHATDDGVESFEPMNPTLTPLSTTKRAAPLAPPAPRPAFYAPRHEALRQAMGDTLARLGRTDAGDDAASHDALDRVDALLALCDDHLRAENLLVHPFIESRAPLGTQRAAAEHADHLAHIADLRGESAALRAAASADRAARWERLDRHLALFVAEQRRHMHHEQTALQALLWRHFDDAELRALHALVGAWLAASAQRSNDPTTPERSLT